MCKLWTWISEFTDHTDSAAFLPVPPPSVLQCLGHSHLATGLYTDTLALPYTHNTYAHHTRISKCPCYLFALRIYYGYNIDNYSCWFSFSLFFITIHLQLQWKKKVWHLISKPWQVWTAKSNNPQLHPAKKKKKWIGSRRGHEDVVLSQRTSQGHCI